MQNDPKALEAARAAVRVYGSVDGRIADIAITAYLAALPSPPTTDAGLVERLKKSAPPSEFRRANPTLSDSALAFRHSFDAALKLEAAARITTLTDANAALREAVEPSASLVPTIFDGGYEDADYIELVGLHGSAAMLRVSDFRKIAALIATRAALTDRTKP